MAGRSSMTDTANNSEVYAGVKIPCHCNIHNSANGTVFYKHVKASQNKNKFVDFTTSPV